MWGQPTTDPCPRTQSYVPGWGSEDSSCVWGLPVPSENRAAGVHVLAEEYSEWNSRPHDFKKIQVVEGQTENRDGRAVREGKKPQEVGCARNV